MLYLDGLIFFGGWLIGQLLFKGYEAHVSLGKKASKLIFLSLIFGTVRHFFGRRLFYRLLGLMAFGMAILHGYWFHMRHGIHWRTAEPRDKYLRLIGKEK